MHDDRITGVTFEENASHNTLIVNEEYAWVGNPFSAPGGGQAETLIESKNPCISLIYKDFFFALNHTARGLPLESPYCVYVDEQNNSIGSNRKEKDTVNA